MPALTYSVADFVAFTKIRSADVNSKFTSIQTLLNTTKLDDDNIQNNGITRGTKLKTGTAGALLVNAITTGAMSEVSPGVQGTIVVGGGAGTPPKFLAAGTAGLFLKSNGSGSDHTYAAAVDNDGNIANCRISASVGSNALTIALKGNDGNDPSSSNPVTIAFRDATLTSGAYVSRTITAALSAVVSAGSTLGHIASGSGGQPDFIYVYAIDNAGTVELAVSSISQWDYGTVISTTAEGGAGAADSRTAIYSTTARSNVACRLIGRLLMPAQTTAGNWASTATEIAGPTIQPPRLPYSEVSLHTANGHGSTNTKFRLFTTTQYSVLNGDFSVSNDGGNGTGISILREGVYAGEYTDLDGSTKQGWGFLVNSPIRGISINGGNTIFDSGNLSGLLGGTQFPSSHVGTVSFTARLFPGDTVYPATEGSASLSNSDAKVRLKFKRVA